MFWRARPRPGRRRRTQSGQGTRGAPWPPAATSALRKSATTGHPSSAARAAGSPSWSVTPRAPSWGGSCQTVCPWKPAAASAPPPPASSSRSARSVPAEARASSEWHHASSRAPPEPIASRIRLRTHARYGRERNPRTSHSTPAGSVPRSEMMMASTPSSEVPDMSPAKSPSNEPAPPRARAAEAGPGAASAASPAASPAGVGGPLPLVSSAGGPRNGPLLTAS